MKKIILTILLCGMMVWGITGCSKDEVKKAEKELQETQEKYGWVEEETVNTIVAKFNTEIMDGGLNTPAMDDYMVMDNGYYWFGITEDISLYLKPVEFSENKENDILDMSGIRFAKEGYDESKALKYVKSLIKANNNNLTDTEIDSLMTEAKEKASSGKTANNGKGISVGFRDANDKYEYQVIRLYK